MSRPKLLLADDSITIQKVVNLTFADHGMDVVTFSDGDSAVENLDEIKPDIVLADVNMPGINGYQLCELMRSDDMNKHIPVVLLVGSFEPFDRDEAERVGANGHLTKPFTSIAELVSTIEGLLSASAASAETPLPETADIDHLYEQSFVETVELPRGDGLNMEFDSDGLDDEMIQTSYAETDPNSEVDDTYFPTDAAGDFDEQTFELADVEAEALIAESFPAEPPPSEPVETNSAAADPFQSVAGEAPPVSVDENISTADTAKFSYEESDLLELPGSSAARPGVNVASDGASGQITSLSPELIDLIVEKVVERLEKKH